MNKKAVLLVLTAAACWGCLGFFVTILSRMGMTDSPLVFIRLLTIVLSMMILIGLKDRSLFRVRLRDLPLFFANAFASIVFFSVCYTAAIRETKIATAAALLYTAPAIVLVLSAILFREKLTAKKIGCILVSIAGCAFVSGIASDGSSLTARGLLLGLGAGLGYGLYSIFSTLIFKKGYSSYTNILYTFLIADLVFLIKIIASGEYVLLISLPAATAICFLNGMITGTCAYTFYTNGLRMMEPSRAAQIATLEPVVAAILGVVIFRQSLSGMELLGIAMVVISVIIMNSPAGDTDRKEQLSR